MAAQRLNQGVLVRRWSLSLLALDFRLHSLKEILCFALHRPNQCFMRLRLPTICMGLHGRDLDRAMVAAITSNARGKLGPTEDLQEMT